MRKFYLLGCIRLFVATSVFLLALPLYGIGATLQWSALPDRERIVITKEPSEGMHGAVARVGEKGLLIPFTEVPSGLFVEKTPEGAALFDRTSFLGRSLALHTQTEKFGFVVVSQTNRELVIDLFADELGARWKPTEKPPTTDVAPNYAVPSYGGSAPPPEMTAPAVVWGQAAQPFAPEKAGQAATPAPSAAPASAPTVTPASALPASASTAQPVQAADTTGTPEGAQHAPVAQPAQAIGVAEPAPFVQSMPVSQVPVVVSASGVPAAPVETSPPVPVPTPVAPTAPSVIQGGQGGDILDIRQDTAVRNAPLPQPDVVSLPTPVPARQPVTVAPIPPAPQTSAQPTPAVQAPLAPTLPAQVAPIPATPVIPAQSAPSAPATPAQSAPVQPASVPPPGVPQPATAAPFVPQVVTTATPVAPPPAPEVPADTKPSFLPGLATPVQGSYRGIINPGGMEDIVFPAQPAPAVTGAPGAAVPVVPASVSQPAQMMPASSAPQGAHQATTAPENAPQAGHQEGARQQPLLPAPPAGAPAGGASHAVKDTPQASGSLEPPVTVNATRENVIYVDEKGNPIEPPADPEARLAEIRVAITEGRYPDALGLVEGLLAQRNLNKPQREEALHIRAEMLFVVHKEDLQNNYQLITDATNEAINANMRSEKNAAALLRLGYVNLKVENIPEAQARFNLLRRQFPQDDNVPLSYYYWGDYYYNRNDLQLAADQFQVILQRYPDSKYAREAALGLARSFYRMGYYQESFSIVEYIERRWTRFYLDYPPFLNMMGDVAFRLGNLEHALRHYWLYANLDPTGEETDIIMTRIGDIYTMQQQPFAASEVYNEVVRRFPDRDGGLVSLMRLAESSINDDPTISTMFNSFDEPNSLRPVDVYEKIIRDHPKSGLVPLAQLKLAMWHLWNHDYIKTLDITSDFVKRFPENPLVPKARELALKTFAILAAESVSNGTYGRMRSVWEKYPILQEQEEILTPESRVALGVSFWKDGKPNEALVAVEPFFLGNNIPPHSEMALSLVLNIYLEYDQWASVEEVARRVQLWNLTPDVQLQLDYALALARENQGKTEAAAVLWQKLYDGRALPDDQMAYATFFLARDAEKRNRLNEAYLLGVEALGRLRAEAEKNPDRADSGKIKSQIASLMAITETGGRLAEALDFARQYLSLLDENSPDRAAVLYRVARVHKKLGDNDAWRKGLTEIAERFPDSVFGKTAASELKNIDLQRDASGFAPAGGF